ncbi:hypothetical protein JYU34_003068 [Plutella xylostella]|uniref:Uncharacterized protein n=1 Tax=Plutella xylostella TaxID=51655 RepID=A0ABQ7QZ32_PLUXY|nr:hypothetical protein JYU34_003068 [Plutella xylostella]
MSFRVVVVLLSLVVCVCCSDNSTEDVLQEEARAGNSTRKRKTKIKMWVVFAVFVMVKLAIAKAASLLFLWGFFQKFCYLVGLIIRYFMLGSTEPPPRAAVTEAPPSTTTSSTPAPPPPPALPDYNTISYSYGPPEHAFSDTAAAKPPDTSYGVPYDNWPYSRRSLKTR